MNIMNIKFICISLVTLALILNVNGKRPKKKRISLEATESTPQPNVVTYSTFGFKDVGAYEGFVPSSPDYATYLTGNSRDSSTRLYAPAFPSSIDTTGLGSFYDPQPDASSHTISSDGFETHVKPYQPVSMNFFTSQSYDTNGEQNKNTGTKDVYDFNNFDSNSPIYGTKLSSKGKIKNFGNVNSTDYNIFNSVSSAINGNTADTDNVSNNNYYPQVSPGQSDAEKSVKGSLDTTQLKFPKVVDFTNIKNYYPTSVESKFTESMHKPYHLDIFNNGVSNVHLNPSYGSLDNNKFNTKDKEEQPYSDKWNFKNEKINSFIKTDEKTIPEVNSLKNEDVSENYPINFNNFKKNKFKHDYKDKVKNKQWNTGVENNVNKHGNSMKGYEYSTNYSNTSFKYDSELPKRPFNSSIDEIVPASSNLDFVDYQIPDKEYSSSYKTSNIKSVYNFDNDNIFSVSKNKYKLPEDNFNGFKSSFTTPATTSHWGSIFKDTEFSSFKSHPKKPSFNDELNDDIVHIPKRQPSLDFEKYFENKPSDWGFLDSYKPYKPVKSRDQYDWTTKELNNRYKSEEDLLGLRNHDTSHPSYVPSFKPNYNFDEDVDYKKLAAKWKQNFLKAKYRDSIREYESFASEPKPVHVPLPKPYPVRVPVIKPYPVHIPQIRPVFHHTKPHEERDTDPYEEDYVPRPDPDRPYNKRQKNSRKRPSSNPKRPSRAPYQDRSRRKNPNRRPSSYQDQRQRRPYRNMDSSEYRSPHRYRDEFDDYDSDSDFERYCKRTGKC
ncbi:putative uncharacterized protein DDB_G0282133 isoform X2 [Bicyclus anynana]|uniref:Uncharacterized protein n=1 Tax=Bicyclus anynana TaxID=110368 RepID=A0A6J1MKU5_BICAN|nr:putative uncharacterized protein DDB_G0282133 isoform X2 [Bicyclus anynana]